MPDNLGFESLWPDELKAYMEKSREEEYLLIDVRQPKEYEKEHIPGAKLIPLMEVEMKADRIPVDRDIIFYCTDGGRSRAAAQFLADMRLTEKRIVNLMGGIMAWEGGILPDIPKVMVFDRGATWPERMMIAMDLEKGAYRFYSHLLAAFPMASFRETVEKLAGAETAHAKAVYLQWEKAVRDPLPFETLFDTLKGEILEGGMAFSEAVRIAGDREGPQCVRVLQMALDIEYAAYDLYRVMAEDSEAEEEKRALLAIAQAEKNHMRTLAAAISRCPELEE